MLNKLMTAIGDRVETYIFVPKSTPTVEETKAKLLAK